MGTGTGTAADADAAERRFAGVAPVSIEPRGNYAVAVGWTDGHAGSIYPYQVTRHTCDCATVRVVRVCVCVRMRLCDCACGAYARLTVPGDTPRFFACSARLVCVPCEYFICHARWWSEPCVAVRCRAFVHAVVVFHICHCICWFALRGLVVVCLICLF